MNDPSGQPSFARFPTTCWSRVVAASDDETPESREALTELFRSYWFPLYAFIRRKGHDPDKSLDLTQSYFARLLERRTVAAANPKRGRFRTFLLADRTHFLAHQREHNAAEIRGGVRVFLSIDARDAEGRFLREPVHDQTPEREWALALLDRVLAKLRSEHEQSGRKTTFEALKVVLTDDPRSIPRAELSAQLGTTEAALQVAIHRLRKRYREHLRAEIAGTLADETEVEDELRALFAALES